MNASQASELLLKLREKGVEMRLNPMGVMQYRDCTGALTPEQEAFLAQHRAALSQALRDVQAGVGEDLAEHLPLLVTRPCFTLFLFGGAIPTCQAFTHEQLAAQSAGEVAAQCRKSKQGCGECLVIHAALWQRKMQQERQEVLRKQLAQVRNRVISVQYGNPASEREEEAET